MIAPTPETTTQTTPHPATTPHTTTSQPSSPFQEGEGHQFKQGWNPEHANVLDRFKNLDSLAKGYAELHQALSSGGRVGIDGYPDGAENPQAMDAWRKSTGVPETADGYEIKPESLPEGATWNEAAESQFKEAFHELGVPPAMAKQLAAKYAEIEVEQSRQAEQLHDQQMQVEQAKLQKKLGNDHQQKLAEMRAVVASHGYDPTDGDIFNNPKVVGFLADLMGDIGEDKVSSAFEKSGQAVGGGSTAARVQSIQQQAITIRNGGTVQNADPLAQGYADGDADAVRAFRALMDSR